MTAGTGSVCPAGDGGRRTSQVPVHLALSGVGVAQRRGRALRVCGRGLGYISYSWSKLKFACNSRPLLPGDETGHVKLFPRKCS